jgi:hypothetical protein
MDHPKSVREMECQCGKLIIINDFTRSVAHEAPECVEFEELALSHGGGPPVMVSDTYARRVPS